MDIAYLKMPNASVYAQDTLGNNTDTYYNINAVNVNDNTLYSGIDDGQKYLKNPVALARLATNNVRNFRITPTFRIFTLQHVCIVRHGQ
jgi:hypothetical protein